MCSLADIQTGLRDALVKGDNVAVAPLLRGGVHPQHRLAIHQRHYATTLTRALVERFPATVWLVGSELVTHAARSFIRRHPPSTPCIAEYGETFPGFPGANTLPYLSQFAELEWHLGRLALATDESPHVHCVRLDWALDELITIYLTDSQPEQFALRREEVWVEIRGLRGELQMTRLSEAEVVTRHGVRL